MYLSFYGLKIKPFQNSTNPSFFWFGEKQREALAIFKYGISKMPGILLLTGDVGTGKTTLINVLLNSLGGQFIVVKVLDPGLEEIDFINHIAEALDFKKKFSNKENFLTDFNRFLETSSALGKKVILVIDECQRLSSQLLDEIIQLANIEKEEKKSLKVLLVGQDAFNDVLQTNKSKSLQQFIAINYAITSLDLEETGEFIRHRLKLAGAERDIFSPNAISKIHEFSGGIPRRINILCDHALLLGFEQGRKTISGELIKACALDLRTPNFLYSPENDSPEAVTGGDSIKRKKKTPEVQQKKIAPRRGRTFSIIMLIIIPVFLLTYFTAPTTYREIMHSLFDKSRQVFTNLYEPNTESRILDSDDDIQKIANEDSTTSDIATIPKTLVTKNNQVETPSAQKLAEVNIPPAGELQQQDIVTDAPPETAGDKPSQTDDLPVIDPIGTIEKGMAPDNEVPPSTILSAEKVLTSAAEMPTLTDNSTVSQITETKEDQVETPSAQKLVEVNIPPAGELQQQDIVADAPPETAMEKPSQTDDLLVIDPIGTIEKDLPPENEMPPPTLPHAEKELTGAPNTPAVAGKSMESKDLLGSKNASQADPTIDKEPHPKTQEVFDEMPLEPIDPGAVIDWVLKNKSK